MNNLIARWTALITASSALALGAAPAAAHAEALAGHSGAAQARTADAGWRVYKTISIRGQSVLIGLDSVSADDAWASGAFGFGARSGRPLIEHWDGRAWRMVQIPGGVAARLGRASPLDVIGASSSRNMWTFGSSGVYAHLHGTCWTVGRLPRSGADAVFVESTTVFGAKAAWVFGFKLVGKPSHQRLLPYAARFDGTRWRTTSVPGLGLFTASAISADDIWGVTTGTPGSTIAGPPEVVRWNGTSWQVVVVQPTPPEHAALSDILALSDHDVWLGGDAPNSEGGTSELAMHWDGTSWSTVSPPTKPSREHHVLTSLAPDGSGGIWVVGGQLLGADKFWHFTDGAWAAPVPANRRWLELQLGWVPGTQSIWATAAVAPQIRKTLILLHGPVPR